MDPRSQPPSPAMSYSPSLSSDGSSCGCTSPLHLSGDNFVEWEARTRRSLIARNLWGVVSGSVPRPTLANTAAKAAAAASSSSSSSSSSSFSSDANPRSSSSSRFSTPDHLMHLQSRWDAADQSARSLIVLTVGDRLLHLISHATSSRDMWEKLSKRFRPTHTVSRVHLNRQLISLKLGQGESLESLMRRCDALVHRLGMTGAAPDDDMVAAVLLRALPAEYDPLAMAISYSGVVTLQKVEEALRREEARRRAA